MWFEFLRFDLRLQLRQWLLWVTALPLALIAFLSASSDGFRIGGAIGNLHLNAPAVIAQQLAVLSIVAMFLVTAFIAGAVLRDTEAGIADLLFATPMRKLDYLGGRFLAGLAVCLLVFGLVTLAMVIGSRMPGIAPDRLSAFSLWPYAWSFAVFVLPNLLFVAALLMLLAATTRSMVMVYVGVVAFLALWAAASFLGQRPDGLTAGALLDPFGVRVLALSTRYFTPAEANTQLPRLAGALLANRLLWSAISLALFAATVVLFKPQRLGTGRGRLRRVAKLPTAAAPAPIALRRIAPRFTHATAWAQCWQLLRFDARGMLKSLPFLVMLMLAVANFLANVAVGGMRLDSTPYPLTRLMLQEISDGMNVVLVVVLLFFSGELVHRDRQLRVADVGDALPVPAWVPLLARCGTLVAVVLAFLGAGVVVAVGIQIVKGGVDLEPLLYLKGTLVNATYFVLMGLALLAVQMMAGNRYIGHAAGAALLASGTLLEAAHLDHRLYNFASLPPLAYSDMNGYGDMTGWAWFALYWGLGAVTLLAIAQALGVRGTPSPLRQRLHAAGRALRGRPGLVPVASLCAFAAVGGWIFHNTDVLNRHASHDHQLDARADYEKAYRGLPGQPQLSLAALRTEVDIFPAQRAATIRAHYTLRNDTATPIATLFFQSDVDTDTVIEQLPAHHVTRDDPRFGVKLIQLDQPVPPGATVALTSRVQVRPRGFTHSGTPGRIHENGTLFTLEDFFPRLSYDASRELDDPRERDPRGLGAPHRLPALEDAAARQQNYLAQYGIHGGLITFEATVSTSADQTAIAPGDLQRQWEHDGRRYFHYKMASPILPFVSFQSGRWQTRTARWHDVDITVFHDARHAWNVDRMLAGAQAALAYNSEHFGPYPHKTLRIVETPLYQSYARSFPMTVPFSESLGFISDLRDAGSVDHVFYVTAHEVAHQWWGDQAIAANVQGAGLITESLAEYSALMTVEHRFGAEPLRHILRFDADEYFRGRGAERVGELPLLRDEGQTYITYRKGSLALMRLKDALGEAAVNRALGRFIADRRYQGPPYATSLDLLAALRAEAPADRQALIGELFERIVVYDNRVLAATAQPRGDGRWEVTLQLSLARLEADAKGKETPLRFDEPVDVAVFAAADRVLYRAPHRLPAGTSTLTFTVREKPLAAAIDPDGLLLDRIPADNRRGFD